MATHAMEEQRSPCSNGSDEFRILPGFSPDAIQSALDYQHKPGQLYVVSYHKCGSTWLQHIVMLILRKGEPIQDGLDYLLATPILELTGSEALDMMNGPGVVKTHLPFNSLHTSPQAKYLYITRNPKDCCVSYYYHTKKWFFYNFRNGTFDQFFDLFITGRTGFSDYFDHLFSWYEHKDDNNVHFLTYENLKTDTRGEVLKLAKFIGEEYYDALVKDSKYMEDVLYYSSLEYMKNKVNDDMESIGLSSASILKEDTPIPNGLKYFFDLRAKCESMDGKSDVKFVRKGIIGDWKNHFSPEQDERMEKWIKSRTEGSDVMNLWKDLIF